MRLSPKLAFTALAASLLLASAICSASARNLSVSNQNIRATWTSLEFNGSGVVVRCQVTFEGSFHTRTIAKSALNLVGTITKAQIKQETCTNGSAATFNGAERYNGTTTPNTLPWHITYKRFEGTLPAISGITFLLLKTRFGVTIPGGICTGQYGRTEDDLDALAVRERSGGITLLEVIESLSLVGLARRDGGIFCPATMGIRGRAQMMLLGTTTWITVTLI